jgi:hypothetical protein
VDILVDGGNTPGVSTDITVLKNKIPDFFKKLGI